MDQLALHIEYLLLRHDCVILPGVGAFIAVAKAAYFDKESLTFFPPTREICFNSSIASDDGLMANSYKRRLKIGFEEGRRILLADISSLMSMLESGIDVTLGKVGTLSKSEEGNIIFQPYIDPEKVMADMGLTAIKTRKDSRIGDSAAVLKESPRKAISASTTENSSEETELSTSLRHTRRFNPNCFYIAINKKMAGLAASILFLLLIAITILVPAPNHKEASQQASVIPVAAISEMKGKESVASASPEVENKEASVSYTEPTHFLIIGTFKTIEEAERFILSQKSDTPMELIEGKHVCRVAAASSTSSESLYAMMRSPEFKAAHPQAWIWIKN